MSNMEDLLSSDSGDSFADGDAEIANVGSTSALQQFVENDSNVAPDKRMAYILLLAHQNVRNFDLTSEPYRSFTNRKGWRAKFKVTKIMIAQEIKRRNPTAQPNCSNRSMANLMAMLTPLKDEEDLKYVIRKETEYREHLSLHMDGHDDAVAVGRITMSTASATAADLDGNATVANISVVGNAVAAAASLAENVGAYADHVGSDADAGFDNDDEDDDEGEEAAENEEAFDEDDNGDHDIDNDDDDDDDITPLPQSDSVTFDELRRYDASSLAASSYYDPGDPDQKPVALTVMGYGVPNFPDVEADVDVRHSISRSKGSMFLRSDFLPDSTRSKTHLQKEVWRRCIVKAHAEGDCIKRHKLPLVTHWNIKWLARWLKDNPPPESEHAFVLGAWRALKQRMRDHFMRNSGCARAVMWRQVRLVEAMLHPDLRADYGRRDDEPLGMRTGVHYGKYDAAKKKSYYGRVAELHNSSEILRSRRLADSYGPPFERTTDLLPPAEEHHVDAEGVRRTMSRLRTACVDIGVWLRNGDERCSVRSFCAQKVPDSVNWGVKVAGQSHASGYGYLAFREEGELEDLTSIIQGDVGDAIATTAPATTMATEITAWGDGRTPEKFARDDGPAPKRRKLPSPPRTGGEVSEVSAAEDRGIDVTQPAMGETPSSSILLARSDERIHHLRCRISMEENSVLNHRKELGAFAREYFSWKARVDGGEIRFEENGEEHEHFLWAKSNYVKCKEKIRELEKRIEGLGREADREEREREVAMLRL